jgi:hypothetical protein
MSIAPTMSAVMQTQLNKMLDEVVTNIDSCRKLWWETQQTTCLENKWMMRTPSGQMEVLGERRTGAKQVRSTTYDAVPRRTTVRFSDGTEHHIEAGGQ